MTGAEEEGAADTGAVVALARAARDDPGTAGAERWAVVRSGVACGVWRPSGGAGALAQPVTRAQAATAVITSLVTPGR